MAAHDVGKYTRHHGLRQYNRNHVEAGKFAELVVPVFLLTVVVLRGESFRGQITVILFHAFQSKQIYVLQELVYLHAEPVFS